MPTRSMRLIPLCGSFGNFSALHPAFGETSGSSRIRKAVQPDEWQTAYADADALIRRYERLYRVEYPTDSARDTAVCAIADAQRRFADVQSGAAAAPASVTIGSVSESYAANTAAAIDATPKAQAAEYYRILCLYADVYRGCS